MAIRFLLIRLLVVLMALAAAPAGAQTDVPSPKLDAQGKIDCEFLRAHHSFLERAKDPGIGVVFLGDSITQGWFWGAHREVWDRYFGEFNPANFGIGGDRTEHVLWRIEQGELDRVKPKVVVLLIGTNNIASPAADIARGVGEVVRHIRERLPASRLLLMAIFPRGAEADDPKRATIREINSELEKFDDGKQIRVLDIGSRFLAADGSLPKEIMPDALHLSREGYQIWAEAITPMLEEMMK